MRQIPDVAAAADPLTGYKIYDSTSGCSGTDCWTAVGGTSAAAPLWGALIVLANQQAKASGKKSMGFINPVLYKMGSDGSLPSPFHDIMLGGNLYYQATSGWDFSTGWGTPDAAVLVKALVDQAPGS
jgi:kumamolisin